MEQIKRGWKMTRREQEDQAQLEWLRKWKERRKEKRDVRKKSLFYKILRKLGIIKDYEEDIRTRMEMCKRAIKANVCPEDCDICAWDVKGGIVTMVILRPVGTTANRLKYLRKIRGLTRKEAAVKLDMKEERLQDLETGRKGLTLGEAIKYADTYNVSIDYIAGRKKVEY